MAADGEVDVTVPNRNATSLLSGARATESNSNLDPDQNFINFLADTETKLRRLLNEGGQAEKFNTLADNLRAATKQYRSFIMKKYGATNVAREKLAASILSFNKIDLSGRDLSGYDLSELEFPNANFARVKFLGANLNRTNFKNSDMTDASFNQANLLETNFEFATLRSAKFIGVILKKTIFKNAVLSGADFTGATLENTNFRNSNMYGVNLTDVKFGIFTNLSFQDTNLSDIKLGEDKASEIAERIKYAGGNLADSGRYYRNTSAAAR